MVACGSRRARLSHQRRDAESPRRDLVGMVDAVDERAQRRRRHRDDVADDVGEALPLGVPVLGRREHRAEEQHEAVGVLMVRPDRVTDEIERIAADEPHRARAVQHEAVRPLDAHRELGLAHVVDREVAIEQADERPDRAGGVVVLGLAEQERAAALEVAEVDVVAECRADRLAAAVHRQHDFRLGIVPLGLGMDADLGAGADRGHRLRLGEDLGIGSDAHFEVLRPRALADQHLLQFGRLGRAGADRGEVVADHRDNRGAHGFRPRRIAARLFLDHPFERARDERDAARLDRLQVARRQQPRRLVGALTGRRIGEQRRERPDAGQRVGRANAPAGSASSSRWLTVGASGDRSHTSSPRTTTGTGPPMAGSHARPMSSARARSRGRHVAGVNRIFMSGSAVDERCGSGSVAWVRRRSPL